MTKRCEVTGKLPLAGNNVSHANNKTRRRFLPNLHSHRFWHPSQKRFVKLKVSNKGLRIIDKYGIEAVLEAIAKNKLPRNKRTRADAAASSATSSADVAANPAT